MFPWRSVTKGEALLFRGTNLVASLISDGRKHVGILRLPDGGLTRLVVYGNADYALQEVDSTMIDLGWKPEQFQPQQEMS